MFFDDLEKCLHLLLKFHLGVKIHYLRLDRRYMTGQFPWTQNNQFIYDKGLVLMRWSSSFVGISLSQTHKKNVNINRQLMPCHLYSVFITIYTFHTCISKEPRRTPIYTWSVNVMARFGIEAVTTYFCASWTVRLVTFYQKRYPNILVLLINIEV